MAASSAILLVLHLLQLSFGENALKFLAIEQNSGSIAESQDKNIRSIVIRNCCAIQDYYHWKAQLVENKQLCSVLRACV